MTKPNLGGVFENYEMRCPKCGADDQIRIEATLTLALSEDGTSEIFQDHDWGATNPAHCVGCWYQGTVWDFELAGKSRAHAALDALCEDEKAGHSTLTDWDDWFGSWSIPAGLKDESTHGFFSFGAHMPERDEDTSRVLRVWRTVYVRPKFFLEDRLRSLCVSGEISSLQLDGVGGEDPRLVLRDRYHIGSYVLSRVRLDSFPKEALAIYQAGAYRL